MKCPNCNHDNPDNNKFCGECGTKLNITNNTIQSVVDDCPEKVNDDSMSNSIIAYNEGENAYFIDSCGIANSQTQEGRITENEVLFSYDSAEYVIKDSELFHVTSDKVVSYGMVEDAWPLGYGFVALIRPNANFSEIYDDLGNRVIKGRKTRVVNCVLSGRYLLGEIAREKIGLIDLNTEEIIAKLSFDEDLPENISSKDDLVVFRCCNSFAYFDWKSMSLIYRSLPFDPKKVLAIDSTHVVIREKQGKHVSYHIYNINGERIASSTGKNMQIFGDVVTNDEDFTLYLPTESLLNYTTCTQIGEYAIVERDKGYGFIHLPSGMELIACQYTFGEPIINDKEEIRYVCFSSRRNGTIIYDLQSQNSHDVEIRGVCMVAVEYGSLITLLSEDSEGCVVLDSQMNQIFSDDWGEYLAVFPMNGCYYYLTPASFGKLESEHQTEILQGNFELMIPLYNEDSFLIMYSDANYILYELSGKSYEIKCPNTATLEDVTVSSLPYNLVSQGRLDDLLIKAITQNTNKNTCRWKGLKKIEDCWKNLFYKPNYEMTLIK